MKRLRILPPMFGPLCPGEMPAFLILEVESEILESLDDFRWLSGISTLQTISESCKLNIIKQIKEKQYD